MDILTTAQSRLQAKLPNLDPTTIIGIITSILQMFSACKTTPTAPTVKNLATQRPIMARIAINNALRSEGIRPMSAIGQQAQEAILQIGVEATEDEIGSFMSYAQNQ